MATMYETRADAAVRDEEELSYAAMESALDTLGPNDEAQIVFTRCTLIHRHLRRIDLLSSFPFLQRLTLDHNELTSLAPLKALNSLTYLSARHNCLTSAAFEHLRASADTLEYVALDHNQLTSLDGLHQLTYLMVLTASYNRIDTVCEAHLRGLRCLLRLDLAHNSLTRIDDRAFRTHTPHLRRVRLGHNLLVSVRFARDLIESTEELDLSHNHLRSLEGVFDAAAEGGAAAQTLAVLDLSSNNIGDIAELAPLRFVNSLHALSVAGNPCLEIPPPASASATATSLSMLEQAAYAAATTSTNTEACIHAALRQPAHDPRREEGDDGDADRAAGAVAASTPHKPAKPSRRSSSQLACTPTRRTSKTKRTSVASLSSVPPSGQGAGVAPREKNKMNTALCAKTTTHYTELSAPQVLGLVRDVLTAPASSEDVKRVARHVELAQLPRARQTTLWLLYTLPQLITLDGNAIDLEDVARAQHFFGAE